MQLFIGVMFFLIGLCAGSFVNMLLYRKAVSYGLVKSRKLNVESQKRSFCDFCGRQLHWYENIPVVSWVILRGKSSCCGRKLPVSYPLLEMGTGILFLFNFEFLIMNYYSIYNIKFLIILIISLMIVTMLVFSAVFDAKYQILPDFSTGILTIMAILLLVINKNNLLLYLLVALAASGFLMVLHLVSKGKGMGMGDVKLAFFIGLLLGVRNTIVTFYLAFIIGAIVGIILLISKRIKRKSPIAFGPFLILGTIIAWYYGSKIVSIFNKIILK